MTWQDLGGPFVIAGTSLRIQLDAGSDGVVSAEAVRVQQLPAGTSEPSTPTVAGGPSVGDPSFEQVPVGSGFAIDPTGSPWSFAGNAGISGNNSGHTESNGPAPWARRSP